jgi:stearoyl-CoA desaturase (delta-9 desaturase)
MEASQQGNRPPVQYGIQKGPSAFVFRLRLGLIYLGAIAALVYYPLTWPLFWLFIASYAVRMWSAEAVLHRFFAHRAFRAGRAMQFVLGVLGCLAGQRGPLWWAAVHHVHHKHADTKDDPHSPVALSFWTAHSGWFLDARYENTNLDLVRYYARYPELRWLNKHYMTPFAIVAALLFLVGHLGWLGPGASGMAAACWGAFLPAVLSVHLFSCVNSFGHWRRGLGGWRRYDTDDHSVNRPILALLTFGTGWHNNHHRYAAASRAGFAWYEIDISYYVLRVLAMLRLVSDLRPVPARILIEGGILVGPTDSPDEKATEAQEPALTNDAG